MKRVGDLVPTLPKWEPCEQCKDTSGWVPCAFDYRPDSHGPIYGRCDCWRAHMQKVAEALRDTKEAAEAPVKRGNQ